jgi:hypothetical protein
LADKLDREGLIHLPTHAGYPEQGDDRGKDDI